MSESSWGLHVMEPGDFSLRPAWLLCYPAPLPVHTVTRTNGEKTIIAWPFFEELLSETRKHPRSANGDAG
jgi:hypothetical protein